MNNTKWDELRLAMHALDRRPLWRCKDVNGHYSGYTVSGSFIFGQVTMPASCTWTSPLMIPLTEKRSEMP
ncbi:DUF6678 family protein [Sinorhizobium meliloti]|uniref:DUF6678 family protein n=1 Tax=Rhizobium meliloti TaxID=382 RepID=UPI001F231A2E